MLTTARDMSVQCSRLSLVVQRVLSHRRWWSGTGRERCPREPVVPTGSDQVPARGRSGRRRRDRAERAGPVSGRIVGAGADRRSRDRGESGRGGVAWNGDVEERRGGAGGWRCRDRPR